MCMRRWPEFARHPRRRDGEGRPTMGGGGDAGAEREQAAGPVIHSERRKWTQISPGHRRMM